MDMGFVHRICIFVYNLVYGNTYDLDLTILILLMGAISEHDTCMV